MENMENMENEHIEPSYWPSVTIGAIVVAVAATVVGLALLYYIAGSEPGMGLLMMSGLFIPATCLVGLIGGVIATRHYAKSFDITFTIGKGALIGLYTGIAAAIISVIIGQLWNLVDPTLMDRFADTMITSFDQADNIPAEQKQESISRMMENFERQKSFGGILQGLAINAGVLGLVNLISGMIGAKIFASEE